MLSYIVTLFLIGYHAHGAVIENPPLGFRQRAQKSVEIVCLKNADQETYEGALEKLQQFHKFWRLSFLHDVPSDDELPRLCLQHREEMLKCTEEFVEKLNPCLSNDESYLGDFLVEAYGNYSNYLCEHILGLAKLDPPSMECITQFVKDSANDPSTVCYENSEVFGNDSEDVVLTKAKLCSDLQSVRTCYDEKFETHCPSSAKLRELVVGLFTEALAPCQDVLEDDPTTESSD